MSATLDMGDVIAVHGDSLASEGIQYKTKSIWSHVAVVGHTDAAGTQWVVEGRPGGVGYRTLRSYQGAKYRMVHNSEQPKDREQREQVARLIAQLLRTPYDWDAIVDIGMRNLEEVGIGWHGEWDGVKPPTHLICSSFAAYLYNEVGLPGPHSRLSTPADWVQFFVMRGWGIETIGLVPLSVEEQG